MAPSLALLLLTGCPGEDPVPIEESSTSETNGVTTTGMTMTTATPTTTTECGTAGCEISESATTTSGDTVADTTEGPGTTEGTTGGTTDGTTGGTTDGTTSGTTDGTTDGTTSGTTGGTTSGTTGGTTSGSSSDGVTFIVPDTDTDGGMDCDPYLQDCPAGEKCNPWGSMGGSWDANGCFPIDPAPVPVGDVCQVVGSGTSGIDNCVAGAMCWEVDVATNEGTCVAQCTGSAMAPVCAAGTNCVIANSGVLNLCLPGCDPLLQDCGAGSACYPIGDIFSCAPDASGVMGVDGDPCEFINVCDPGLMCIGSAAVEPCGGASGCCTPFCDLSVPGDPCPAGTEECVPWYELGMAPLGLEDVGVCAIP